MRRSTRGQRQSARRMARKSSWVQDDIDVNSESRGLEIDQPVFSKNLVDASARRALEQRNIRLRIEVTRNSWDDRCHDANGPGINQEPEIFAQMRWHIDRAHSSAWPLGNAR